ncbi:MAG TPA: sigma factor-like helix-turn-helix DNA-binding protein [Sphingomicrobium sp.]|nr:sigma factor-like helix-turn-helix DNA-binding protein [Sphingomicrobium sp.]
MARDRPSVTLERLEQAASSLRPIEREVLVLSAREHLSSNEIAARLGITTTAAERILVTALCKLDRALERQERALRRPRPWWRFW